MVNRATGTISDAESKEYVRLRHAISSDRAVSEHLPDCVKMCRTLDEFWAEINLQSGTYKGRKAILRDAFDPLLTYLENERHAGLAESRNVSSDPEVDELCSRLVQLLMLWGAAREVAILTAGRAALV